MSLMLPLQIALVARLKAGATAGIVGERIYDGEAPPRVARPYVVVGEPTEVPGVQAMGGHGHSDTVMLHAVSDYPGNLEVLALLAAINADLGMPLEPDGYAAATLRQEFATVLVERDGDTVLRHAPARFRAVSWPS